MIFNFRDFYLGISSLDFSFAYSANVNASSRDRHLLRSLDNVGRFKIKTKSNALVCSIINIFLRLFYSSDIYTPRSIGKLFFLKSLSMYNNSCAHN